MKFLVFHFFITIICCNQFFCQESKEIDFVILVDGSVINAALGLSFKVVNEESSFTIYPQYHPGNLTFKESDFKNLINSKEKTYWLRFYLLNKESHYDYAVKVHRDWFKERFIVLNINNLKNRRDKKLHKPIERGANYGASIDFGHVAILNLNNEKDPVVVRYH
ncbi:hypothetical protein GTQ34_16105 [Muricauda sp. JGD-17]|uniref:Uncharacterized protein n=1 Tax=Flagellimonas ochracea TaxID=2696472 RepID=A0A964TEF2_9FLAO|nr:hypothetical protein [Allomuricauda ochracea]NAY93435.1 hypothetical protein [Allomuricauda ochracea]